MITIRNYKPRPTRMLDRFFEDSLMNPDWMGNLCTHTLEKDPGYPAVDIREEDDSFVLEADLPGLTEKDIDLQVDGNQLNLSSKEAEKKGESKQVYLIKERRTPSFSRSFVIPENVNKEGISADVKDGVLSVNLPKAPETKPKHIEVKPR